MPPGYTLDPSVTQRKPFLLNQGRSRFRGGDIAQSLSFSINWPRHPPKKREEWLDRLRETRQPEMASRRGGEH